MKPSAPLHPQDVPRTWLEPRPASLLCARALADRWVVVQGAVDALQRWLPTQTTVRDAPEVPSEDGARDDSTLSVLDATLAGLDAAFGRALVSELPQGPFRTVCSTLNLLADSSPQALLEEMAILAWLNVPSLVRAPRSWQGLAMRFLEALRSAGLADALHLVRWPHDEASTLRALVSTTEVVRVWGRTTTWTAVQEAARGTSASLHFFGPKLSLALVSHPDSWPALARDVRVMEQEGCFSPQWVLFSDPEDGAEERALNAAAEAMADEHARHPRSHRSPEQAAEVMRRRTEVEFSGGHVRQGPWGDVFLHPKAPVLLPGPGSRVLQLAPLPAEGATLRDLLAPIRGSLSSVACDRPLPDDLLAALRHAGAWRFCRPGQLQSGRPSNVHDGRSRLDALLIRERWD